MVLSIFLGIGLAAAVGFRVFVPFFLISLAHYAGYLSLSEGFQWMGSTAAMVTFAIATTIEILAYFIPWLDNALDLITTPLAVVGGTILMSSAVGEIDPLLQWTVAIIAGGGTAGIIKGLTSSGRLASSVGSGGLANPVISSGEAISSILMTILSFVLPYLAAFFAVVLFVVGISFVRKRRLRASSKKR